MLEYIKTFFPQIFVRIKNFSLIVKIISLLLIIMLPFLIQLCWDNKYFLNKLLSSEIKINGYHFLIVLMIIALIWRITLSLRNSKKKLLKIFVQKWIEFTRDFELLYTYVDVWLIRNREDNNDELWNLIVTQLDKYWPAKEYLRKLLFEIGESKLIVYDNKHWGQLKKEDDLFKERNYESPFSLLLDLSAPIGEINHHKKAINWSLKISDEYIEHLGYKHKYLEKYTTSLKYNSKNNDC